MGKPPLKIPPDLAEALTVAWAGNVPVEDIARQLGLSKCQVDRRREKLGLPLRKHGNTKLSHYEELRIYIRADDLDKLRSRTNSLGVTMSRYLRDMVLADLERSAG